MKLLGSSRTDRVSSDDEELEPFTPLEIAYLAIFDTRLLLNFAPPCPHQIQARLVEKYMRVAFSISQHGEHIFSGYPSEPILAEAAARHMQELSGVWGKSDRAARFLLRYAENGLIVGGERGELVARLLLTLAFDRAQRTRHRRENRGSLYSDPVPVGDFLTALLGEKTWQVLKASRPDNVKDNEKVETLGEAFKHACVRFTHFN
jgi:hypothetical protein